MSEKKRKSVEGLGYKCGMCEEKIAKYVINEWVFAVRYFHSPNPRKTWYEIWDAIDTDKYSVAPQDESFYPEGEFFHYFPICESCGKKYKVPKKYLIDYYPLSSQKKKALKEAKRRVAILAKQFDELMELIKRRILEVIDSEIFGNHIKLQGSETHSQMYNRLTHPSLSDDPHNITKFFSKIFSQIAKKEVLKEAKEGVAGREPLFDELMDLFKERILKVINSKAFKEYIKFRGPKTHYVWQITLRQYFFIPPKIPNEDRSQRTYMFHLYESLKLFSKIFNQIAKMNGETFKRFGERDVDFSEICGGV